MTFLHYDRDEQVSARSRKVELNPDLNQWYGAASGAAVMEKA
jgi:hypothetical protein